MNNYRHRFKAFWAVSLFLLALLTLSACVTDNTQTNTSNDDVQMTSYSHDYSGMVFQVPSDWVKKSEDDHEVVFTNPKGTVSLSGIFELGGYSYYTPEEMGGIVKEICQKSLTDIETLQEGVYDKKNNSYKVVMQGVDAEGETIICEAVVYAPLDGVRYYLVALAGVDDYRNNYETLAKTFASFNMTMDEDTLYGKMEENKNHVSAE